MKKVVTMVFPFVMMILAIVSFVFAGTCFGLYAGAHEASQAYGGDAYTGIQNAAAQAANNIRAVGDLIASCFGYVFIFAGLLLLVFAIKGVLEILPSIVETMRSAAQMKPAVPTITAVPVAPVTPVETVAAPVPATPVAPAQPAEPVPPIEETKD